MSVTNRTTEGNVPMMLETLESRQLMSGTTWLPELPQILSGHPQTLPALDGSIIAHGPSTVLGDDGVLRITGTAFGDKVTVSHKNGKLTVTSGFFGLKKVFATADVKRIEANLGGGDDVLAVRGDFDVPMNINGEAGNDRLTGGSADDRIDGGAGRDVITGGLGHDQLIGGRDEDLINAFDGTPGSPTRSFSGGTADEVFADDGAADRIQHDSPDNIHSDSRDFVSNLNRIQTLIPRLTPEILTGLVDPRFG